MDSTETTDLYPLQEYQPDYSKPIEEIKPKVEPAGCSFILILAGVSTTLGLAMSCGYGIGVMNSPAVIIKQFCNTTIQQKYGLTLSPETMDILWSTIVSIFIVGGVTGSLSGAWIANKVGRKGAIVIANLLAIISGTLFMCSKNYTSVELLLLGRLVLGLSGGITTSVMPIYLTELATINLRGVMGTLCPLGLCVGLLFSQVMGLKSILGLEGSWHYLLSFYVIFVVLGTMALTLLPESPKYLFVIRNQQQNAIQELSRIRGVPPHELSNEIDLLKASKRLEEQAGVDWTISTVLKDNTLSLPLALVCVLQAGQQCSGINAVFYYSVSIFKTAGLTDQSAQYANIGAGALNLLMSLLSVPIVACTGRKTLALFSSFTAGLCLLLLAFSVTFMHLTTWMPTLCMCAVFLYVIFYGFGLGPIPFFIGSELFEIGPRPAAMALGSMCNWGGNFIIGMTFPTLQNYIGAASFVIFAGVCFALFGFVRLYLPETKDRDVGEIAEQCSEGFKRLNK